MKIREAESADIPAIVAMGEHFFAASGYGDFTTFDQLSAARTFESLISSPDGVILVAEKDGRAVATAAALIFPFFFNSEHRHAQEFFWWAEPEARGAAGPRLLIELERWCRDHGAKSLSVAALASLRPSVVASLYARAGFRVSDASYVKGL
jgi:GNAT superfamily N-acetyltransferase